MSHGARLGVRPTSVGGTGLLAAGLAVARRPDLWGTAIRSIRELARPRWWSRAPFLPIPDRRWLRFRLVTAYGGRGDGAISADDLVTWLEWRRSWPVP